MAPDPKSLTIEPGAWGPDADRWIEPAAAGALADIRAQVEAGAALFYVRSQGGTVGAFVLRVDHTAEGPQGVIVAASATMEGVDMTATCLPVIERLFSGCKTIRYHTRSPALARKLAGYGYRPAEIVSIKEIEA